MDGYRMVSKSELEDEYELDYSSQTVFDCLKDSLGKIKILRAHPEIKEINESNMTIDCITPGYNTKITVVDISQNKSIIKFFLKSYAPGQKIDLWNRHKKNVKAIMNQLLKDLGNPNGINNLNSNDNKDISTKEVKHDKIKVDPKEDKDLNSKNNEQITVNNNESFVESMKNLLFYWVDKNGNARLAKTKVISIGLFIILFIFDRISNSVDPIVVSFIFTLMFVIPIFVIGLIIHFLTNR